ncbi:MAG: DUF1772 domain-containing protein [Bacteroidetes bacterium]|nr:DUF1772 domain-containing protein [Bacteroidota bacterium]
MQPLQNALMFVTVVFAGLIAGLLFSYQVSVNNGLKALTDAEYVKAMQTIKVSIINPLFIVCFIGLLFLFPVSSYDLFRQGCMKSFYFMLIACLIYLIGVICVTFFGNIPLNNLLKEFDVAKAMPEEVTTMRKAFEITWNQFHLIRTIASITAFVCALFAVFRFK